MNEFLTTMELALKLNVKPSTIKAWRRQGRGPVYHRFGRSIRYRVVDVDRWAAHQAAKSGAGSSAGDKPGGPGR